MIFANKSQHIKSLQILITLTPFFFIIYSSPIHKIHRSEVNRMSYHSQVYFYYWFYKINLRK